MVVTYGELLAEATVAMLDGCTGLQKTRRAEAPSRVFEAYADLAAKLTLHFDAIVPMRSGNQFVRGEWHPVRLGVTTEAVRQIQADVSDALNWRDATSGRTRRTKADSSVVLPWRRAAKLFGLGADVISAQTLRNGIAVTPDALLLHNRAVVRRALADVGDLLRVVADAYPLVHSACSGPDTELDQRLAMLAPVMARVAARCEVVRRAATPETPNPLAAFRLPHSFDLDDPDPLTRFREQLGFVRSRMFGWEGDRLCGAGTLRDAATLLAAGYQWLGQSTGDERHSNRANNWAILRRELTPVCVAAADDPVLTRIVLSASMTVSTLRGERAPQAITADCAARIRSNLEDIGASVARIVRGLDRKRELRVEARAIADEFHYRVNGRGAESNRYWSTVLAPRELADRLSALAAGDPAVHTRPSPIGRAATTPLRVAQIGGPRTHRGRSL